MPCPSVVRIARPEDHSEIWRLFLQGHHENGLFKLAPDKVDWFIHRALHPEQIPDFDTGARGTIGVIGPVGSLEGIVFVTIGQFWYSTDHHLEEFIVYVDPECRRPPGHVQALVNWMKQQSDLTGLPLMTGIMSTQRTEAKCRLYGRMLPKVGEFFFYGGKGAGTVMSSSAVPA